MIVQNLWGQTSQLYITELASLPAWHDTLPEGKAIQDAASGTTSRDPHTNCAHMHAVVPMNFVTWCHHKHFMATYAQEINTDVDRSASISRWLAFIAQSVQTLESVLAPKKENYTSVLYSSSRVCFTNMAIRISLWNIHDTTYTL